MIALSKPLHQSGRNRILGIVARQEAADADRIEAEDLRFVLDRFGECHGVRLGTWEVGGGSEAEQSKTTANRAEQ
jgi:hypothetical protein